MASNRVVAPLLASLLLAGATFAQTAPAEFGRASGGQIDVLTKSSRDWSGSLGISTSRGRFGSAEGYEGSLGGTIVEDRIWFFAAGSVMPVMPRLSVAETFDARMMDAKLTAQLGDRTSVNGTFSQGQFDAAAAVPGTLPQALRSSFLSLRSDWLVSSNISITTSVSRHR